MEVFSVSLMTLPEGVVAYKEKEISENGKNWTFLWVVCQFSKLHACVVALYTERLYCIRRYTQKLTGSINCNVIARHVYILGASLIGLDVTDAKL